MPKPGFMAIATAVMMAGISNALIYVLGYVALVAFLFLTGDSGDASFASASSAFIISLMFTLLLSCIITFLVAFPIAVICRTFGFIGKRAFVIAPAIGAALVCWIASKLDVATTTYIAIIAFAFITAGIMWLALGKGAAVPAAMQPAQ